MGARRDGASRSRSGSVRTQNPLTARVIVNRVWHHHFGRGIVATLDNFGKMGEQPTHPELLDWLAVEFMKRGWSLKQLHRLMMTSEAYQMVSAFDHGGNVKLDPGEPAAVAVSSAAARCRNDSRQHPRGQRRHQPDDGRAADFSRTCRRTFWQPRRPRARGRTSPTVRPCGGAASTSISAARCRSRCSRRSIIPI